MSVETVDTRPAASSRTAWNRAAAKRACASALSIAVMSAAWAVMLRFGLPALRGWCKAIEHAKLRESALNLVGMFFPEQIRWSILLALACAGAILAIWVSGRQKTGARERWLFAACALALAPYLIGLAVQYAPFVADAANYEVGVNDLLSITATVLVAILAVRASAKSALTRPGSASAFLGLAFVAAGGPLGAALGFAVYTLASAAIAMAIAIVVIPILLPFMLSAMARSV